MNFTLDPLPPPAHLPRLALEEAAVAAPSAEISNHLAGCPACQTYVQTLRENAVQFLKARPSDRFMTQVLRRESRPTRAWRPVMSAALAIAVGGVVTFAFRRDDGSTGRRAGMQFKGSIVSTFVQRQGQAVPLRPGDSLHPRDAVRFVVRSEQPGFAAVLERDPEGRVTVVAPFGAPHAQPVTAGSTPLADSAILDSTLGTDHFVAIVSPNPLPLGPLVEALSAGRSLDCDGCQVELLDFDKRP